MPTLKKITFKNKSIDFGQLSRHVQIVFTNKQYYFIVLSIMLMHFTYSQPNNNISVISPEAVAIGKNSDHRVNLATGVPNISIPIYNINYGPINHNISLNYHAGGIRVSEKSNWVGLGWKLSSDQMITRVIRGIPDEMNTGYFTTGHSLYHCQQQMDLDLSFPIHPCLLLDIVNGNKDGEPDLFHYNFNGYSGTFYIGLNVDTDQLEVRKIEETDLKINFNINFNNTQGQRIQGFEIITPDGIKYIFGTQGNESAIDKSQIDLIGTYNESWRLLRILDTSSDHEVFFEYSPNNYNFHVNANNVYMRYEEPGGIQQVVTTTTPSFLKYVEGYKLNTINYGNITIEFIANTVREDVGLNNKMLSPLRKVI